MKARQFGDPAEKNILIHCPGCNESHVLNIDPTKTYMRTRKKKLRVNGKILFVSKERSEPAPCWKFNNDFANPTFTPSLLVRTGKYCITAEQFEKLSPESKEHYEKFSNRCHSYITDGFIKFLGDSTHKLKNQTVELPEL